MGIRNEISKITNAFLELLIQNDVKYLYAFGSSVSDKFDPDNSDLDFVVEINEADPVERGEKLMNLWYKFEQLFKKKVDLLTDSSIRNPVLRENIEKTKVLIYDGQDKKILI